MDPRGLGHIGVLMGGCSSEREISLRSGAAILEALRQSGCRVSQVEIFSADEDAVRQTVRQSQLDVAFIALHGKFGEDGTLQGILEAMGVPYTGSGPEASRLAMNKATTQSVLRRQGLPVPEYRIIRRDSPGRAGDLVRGLRFPVVVKPSCEGSSIGISICQVPERLGEAVERAWAFGPEVIVEEFISGRELTVGILGGEALPVIEIRAPQPFFDFTAKYQKGMTEYLVPAPLEPAVASSVQDAAWKAFNVVGCRDMGRIDVMLDAGQRPFILEINTIPGFTATSLLPKAAAQAGYPFPQLCLKIVAMAVQRAVRPVRSQPSTKE